MVKSEQFKDNDQLKRVSPAELATPFPLRSTMFQTKSTEISQRTIDPRAIDISSIKGRFAWEKITLGDTYIPVIFRGNAKYFCVKMLHKLLTGYPEDFIRRSLSYQYRKPIDLYVATSNELALLNRINIHHCHGAYSRGPFTIADELVRVLDFLPFYEHLQLYGKSSRTARTTTPASSPKSAQPQPPKPKQPQKSTQRSPDFIVHVSNGIPENATMAVATTSIQTKSHSPSQSSRANSLSISQFTAPSPSTARSVRPPKSNAQLLATARQALQQQLVTSPAHEPMATSSTSTVLWKDTEIPNRSWPAAISTSPSRPSISTASAPTINLTPHESTITSPLSTSSGRLSIASSEKSLTPISKPSSSSPSASKSPSFYSGWLQINKLYTPYIATQISDHHLYKIPVSLLTFYDLIRIPSLENDPDNPKDSSLSFEKALATPEEIELINSLCVKQSIKPFSIDTKLINLATFYQYSSASILFVKELPSNDPKAHICKDWSSIVRTNGGICRLRNSTTLHEQTVPFIGNNLLKDFNLSSQSLASASLTIPTAAELEFLQLILFFSNISIDLQNTKLIDIKSVQNEYNVDLLLLFNDKFPLNVLDYHYQGNRSTTTQSQVNQRNSSATTNTFAQSTPPPSPVSSPTNIIPVNPTSQLPSSSSSTSSNRYQKTILFHGQSMTAYICSGLGTNAQRECISVRALCNVLYPNSSILDKLELRLLRLLRLKNINRFRPQNQQTIGLTRLVDVKDVESHWDYIQQGMCSLSDNEKEKSVSREVISSRLEKDLTASTLDKGENNCKNLEETTSIEVQKGEKRSFEREMEKKPEEKPIQEVVPIRERLDKRIRFSDDSSEKSTTIRPVLTRTISNQRIFFHGDSEGEKEENENSRKLRRNCPSPVKIVPKTSIKKIKKKPIPHHYDRPLRRTSALSRTAPIQSIKKKIKIIRRQKTPRVRTHKQSVAAWIRKYGIEDCCIRLDVYDPIYETGKN